MSVRCKLLPFFLVLSFSVPAISASPTPSGTLLLIGDVLSFNQRIVWQRIFELSGGDAADIVVIAAAHSRAKLYGGYAQRALSRYGPFVELLPLAVSPAEFNTHYRQAAHNPELVEQVQESNAVFFVGGAPQHLAEVMFSETGSPTPLAMAISQVYAAGGVIVGGIPGAAGAYTDIDAMRVLKQGQVPNNQLYQGLGLLAEGWYADQHFFSPGRFAETLVAMRQLAMDYGIGVGANAAAVIHDGQLEVIGEGGVMIIDLSTASTATAGTGFNLKGVRLSYLDEGDRITLATSAITPHFDKLEGFEIDPNAVDHQPLIEDQIVARDMFAPGRLVQLLVDALDSQHKQTIGLALPDGTNEHDSGFQFRFYTADDTLGWLTTQSGSKRYTVHNIYLDITPFESHISNK